MIFNSLVFVYFFIVVTSLFFLLPHKFRWFLLLAASCYFYMYFKPVYILILGFTIAIDYIAGIQIAKHEGRKRKFFLVMSLVANIGVLAFFKYYNFLNDTLTSILGWASFKNDIPVLEILLPVGLSFHTFQAMSYTIEVYRGKCPPERHFGIFSLYVMFYPQLVAGPIERPQNLLHQFHERKNFDYDRVVSGFKIMLWGFVKKILIADRLAIYVDAVFNNVHQHSGITMLFATFFFGIQIYCDFSGYSDIAIGAAKVMGYKLMTNFRRPMFISQTIQEFWQRWHISLTTWFRDYLYYPLGGNKKGKLMQMRNMLIVFSISGLWHGANWTFVIWGLANGTLLALEQIYLPYLNNFFKLFGPLKKYVRILYTILFTLFPTVFFRVRTVDDGFYMLKSIFTFKPGGLFKGEPPTAFGYAIFAFLFLVVVEHIWEFYPKVKVFNSKSIVVRYAAYVILIILLLTIGVFNGGQFIYFQF